MLSEAICGRLYYCWANIHCPSPFCMEEIFFPTPLIVGLDSLVPAFCLERSMSLTTSVLSDWIPSEKTGRTELLLLLLSRFSRVHLCATPETAAHQAPLSLGFSRQEHWSGLPFPSPMHESEKWNWSHSVVSNSSRPHGPGSSIHGIFQARALEWGAIAFSKDGAKSTQRPEPDFLEPPA